MFCWNIDMDEQEFLETDLHNNVKTSSLWVSLLRLSGVVVRESWEIWTPDRSRLRVFSHQWWRLLCSNFVSVLGFKDFQFLLFLPVSFKRESTPTTNSISQKLSCLEITHVVQSVTAYQDMKRTKTTNLQRLKTTQGKLSDLNVFFWSFRCIQLHFCAIVIMNLLMELNSAVCLLCVVGTLDCTD